MCSKQSLLESAYKTPSPWVLLQWLCLLFVATECCAFVLFCFEQPNLFGSRNKRKKIIWAPSMSSNQPGDTPVPLSEIAAYRNPGGEVTLKARLGMVSLCSSVLGISSVPGAGACGSLYYYQACPLGEGTGVLHVLR